MSENFGMNLWILVPAKADQPHLALLVGGKQGFRHAIRNKNQARIVFIDYSWTCHRSTRSVCKSAQGFI